MGEAAAPEQLSAAWLAAQLEGCIGPLRGQRLCVAYSGGLDSSVLLALLASLRRPQRLRLRALHVNHHLHAESGDWARAAARQARRWRIACTLIEAPVRREAGESLEAAARVARYGALARQLRPGELLVTAHHQEDQLETVLLALLRGSGVRGLAAMSPVSAWAGTRLLRPLLPVGRAQLLRFARASALQWSDDPSNLDERFDRNFLRRRVLPLIVQRWPAAPVTVARSAAHLAEARALLDELARTQLAAARDGAALRASALAQLSAAQRRNALRYWLAERGLPPPDHRRLREIAGPLLRARADASPQVSWRGGVVRRHAGRLYAQALQPDAAPAARPRRWAWRRQRWLALEDGSTLGLLRDPHGDVRLAALPEALQVRFRQGGERLAGGPGRIALKDLLQAQGLAPWERREVPLIGDGERIFAVADFWLDPAYRVGAAAVSAAERGRFRWRRALR